MSVDGRRREGETVIEEKALNKRIQAWRESDKVKEAGVYPYFREISSAQDTVVLIDGREVLMFGSNSYLGLNNHPEVKQAAVEAIEKYGTGCSGSRFLNGNLDIHRILEEELAELVGKERAVVFSTGFQANLGAISTLVGKGEYVVTDRLDHASIIEGCRLSFGKKLKFDHNDAADLDAVLGDLPAETEKLVIVDGVYSMEGDIARLPEIVEVCRRRNAAIMVDDAHGLGVLGPGGTGTAAHFGLTGDVQVIMGTFSKSFASLGGFIASDARTIEYLKHTARALMFSASMPPPNVAAVRAALAVMKREPERLGRLWENTGRMMTGLRSLGFDTGVSESPIIPVRVGGTYTTFRMCTLLQEEGVFVNPVVAPAVPDGECLIRLSLMATHSSEQIDQALDRMGSVGRALGVI
jgi:8-amino-7-oxononanoate synthase